LTSPPPEAKLTNFKNWPRVIYSVWIVMDVMGSLSYIIYTSYYTLEPFKKQLSKGKKKDLDEGL